MINDVNIDFYERLLLNQVITLLLDEPSSAKLTLKESFQMFTKASDTNLPEYYWFTYALTDGNSKYAFAENLERIMFINLELQDNGPHCLKTRPVINMGEIDKESEEWVQKTLKPYCDKLARKHFNMWYKFMINKESRGARTGLNKVLEYFNISVDEINFLENANKFQLYLAGRGVNWKAINSTSTNMRETIPSTIRNQYDNELDALINYWPIYKKIIE